MSTDPVEPIVLSSDFQEPARKPPSRARLAANRANAQKSTGPRTSIGRRRVATNAIKYGLTGQHLVLQPSELIPYLRTAMELIEEIRPVDARQEQIAQKLVDLNWRSQQCSTLSINILLAGMEQDDDAPESDAVAGAAFAQVDSARADSVDGSLLEKISRIDARLQRQQIQLAHELERIAVARHTRAPRYFKPETCRAYLYYQKLLQQAEANLNPESSQPAPEPQNTPAEPLNIPAESPRETAETAVSKTVTKMGLNCKITPQKHPTLPPAERALAEIIDNLAKTYF